MRSVDRTVFIPTPSRATSDALTGNSLANLMKKA
jgi:hypothetical protein